MAFLLNGQPLGVDRPFTDADGTQYPANWLRHASADEKAAIGIPKLLILNRMTSGFIGA